MVCRIEDAIHISIKKWLEAILPSAVVIHVPNDGKRSKAAGARLKRLGLLAGWPDLTVMLPAEGKTVLFEVKAPKGRLSEDQKFCHAMLREKKIPVAVVRSIEEARAALASWNIPTREAMS